MSIIIYAFCYIVQIIIIQFGAFPFFTKVLTLDQWAWSIFFGLFELVWALVSVILFIENKWKQDNVVNNCTDCLLRDLGELYLWVNNNNNNSDDIIIIIIINILIIIIIMKLGHKWNFS